MQGGLSICLDGIIQRVHEILRQIGRGQQFDLVLFAGSLDLSKQSNEASLADVAVLVGETVYRSLHGLKQHTIILTLHFKIF